MMRNPSFIEMWKYAGRKAQQVLYTFLVKIWKTVKLSKNRINTRKEDKGNPDKIAEVSIFQTTHKTLSTRDCTIGLQNNQIKNQENTKGASDNDRAAHNKVYCKKGMACVLQQNTKQNSFDSLCRFQRGT